VILKIKNSLEQSDNHNDFISIPIGRSGRDEIKFEMGMKSDVYHCMIAGQSGTGKSTFLNLIITKIAELYTPDEIKLYLLDYKEGVEFGIYKNHPNVVSLLLDNSNIEYAINVLEEFESEIQKRAELFSRLGSTIKNIDKYNSKSDVKIPRLILIIDEVQELFTKGYEFSRKINKILIRVAKQGRSFGIHFIFCSQSYADCKIDDSVLKQTKLRISFRLPDNSDCRSIMGRDNDAPLRLKRFQIVYNADNGNSEKNIIASTYNFDEEKIENILKTKSEEYEKDNIFTKNIIDKSNSSDRLYDNPNLKESGTSTIKTVKRECKIQINNQLDDLN
jgi:hypothetical protein